MGKREVGAWKKDGFTCCEIGGYQICRYANTCAWLYRGCCWFQPKTWQDNRTFTQVSVVQISTEHQQHPTLHMRTRLSLHIGCCTSSHRWEIRFMVCISCGLKLRLDLSADCDGDGKLSTASLVYIIHDDFFTYANVAKVTCLGRNWRFTST